MGAVRVGAFLLAAVIVGGTLMSAVHTFVLPRAAPVRLSRAVFLVIRFFVVRVARLRRDADKADDTLALFAPISLLSLPMTWLAIIGASYTVMFWAVEQHNWRHAFRISGSSMFTLGFVRPHDAPATFLAFSEAAFGLGLLALLLTYLPSMYAAFARREAHVALLEGRAGRPPWAVTMIVRFHAIGAFDRIDEVWIAWEEWFVDIEESHLSLAALPFYRSPVPGRSWVTAAGTVLDAGALIESAVDTPHSPRAQLCIRAGFLSLRRIADFFNVPHNADPSPDDPISITREEFDDALARMAEAGVPLKRDRDQAWRDFSGWRVNYDTVLLALAAITMAPEAPWSSDRMPGYRRMPVTRRARARVPARRVTRRRWAGLAVLALAATVVGVVASTRGEDGIGRGGSTELGGRQPVGVGAGPASYRVTYRLEEQIDDVRVSTQRMSVRRPFESRLDTLAGPPPGGDMLVSDIWTRGRSYSDRANAAPIVSDQPIEVATADLRLDTLVDGAVADGALQRRERRRVAGRVCQVFRSRDRLAAVTLRPPAKQDFVDSCIDREGLLLEEVRHAKGKVQLRRIAIRVETAPEFASDEFAVGAPNIDVPHGGGKTSPVDPATSPPGQFWVLDAPPAGFIREGRVVVVPPQPENFTDPLRDNAQRASTVDWYRRGVDVIVFEQGGTKRGAQPWEPDTSLTTADVPPLGRAEILLTGRGPELRVLTGGGHYVRIYGTVPLDTLLTVARNLRSTEGANNLRYL